MIDKCLALTDMCYLTYVLLCYLTYVVMLFNIYYVLLSLNMNQLLSYAEDTSKNCVMHRA